MFSCIVHNAWDAIAQMRFNNPQFSFKDLQLYLFTEENREEMRKGRTFILGARFGDTLVFFRLLNLTVP